MRIFPESQVTGILENVIVIGTTGNKHIHKLKGEENGDIDRGKMEMWEM